MYAIKNASFPRGAVSNGILKGFLEWISYSSVKDKATKGTKGDSVKIKFQIPALYIYTLPSLPSWSILNAFSKCLHKWLKTYSGLQVFLSIEKKLALGSCSCSITTF